MWIGALVVMLAGAGVGAAGPVEAQAAGSATAMVPVGVAVVDITPDYPIRLTGYGSRQTESEGVATRLKARALAIGADPGGARGEGGDDGPAVLLAVDNCAVGAAITEQVAARLKKRVGLKRERFVVCSTHTHCAPALSSELAYIFGRPIPQDQKERIERYGRELAGAMEKVALAALADRASASLAWGQGRVGFAANRRVLKDGKWVNFGVNPNGPVDPSLPVLRATGADGKVRAVLVGYACHCTTLGGEFNKICAEWAGFACDEIERQSPGSVALAVIGCGADANPEPRRNLDDARHHGAAVALEANRLITSKAGLTPLPGRVGCRYRELSLPLEPPPDRATLVERSRRTGSVGLLAQTLLARLDRGEALATTVPYRVQTWCFGDEMAVVFLAGEVVVDYALRLKWEIDTDRIWTVAYSNDVPCYIPSRRILSEGGYEADMSMVFYGHPNRLAPETEDRIVQAVHDLLPQPFDGPRVRH
jgi:hypothetical protein